MLIEQLYPHYPFNQLRIHMLDHHEVWIQGSLPFSSQLDLVGSRSSLDGESFVRAAARPDSSAGGTQGMILVAKEFGSLPWPGAVGRNGGGPFFNEGVTTRGRGVAGGRALAADTWRQRWARETPRERDGPGHVHQ